MRSHPAILGRQRRWFAQAVLLILLGTFTGSMAGDDLSPNGAAPLFRFGFSNRVLREFNENDAKAALKVWVETLARERLMPVKPDVVILQGQTEFKQAIQQQSVDGICMTADEFGEVYQPGLFNRFMFAVRGGEITEEYVLLVHARSGITNLADLRGRSLCLFEESRMCLATLWLDTHLMEQKHEPAIRFFSRITGHNKLTKVILPVFFRQADACLLTRNGYKVMTELNPQLGTDLRVLAASPPFVTTGFFFRSAYPIEPQHKIILELTQIHSTASGQQVLTVFQTDRLEERTISCMATVFELLESHRRLLAGGNGVRSRPNRLPLAGRKEGY